MIIIIEGPDGSGKSTLAKALADMHGWPIVHMDKPKTEQEKAEMANTYYSLLVKADNLILDRSWYSEMVYGPIMRGHSAISTDQMIWLEKTAMLTNQCQIIYCNGDPGETWERCQLRGESHVKSYAQYLDIVQLYRVLMLQTGHLIPITVYNQEKEETK